MITAEGGTAAAHAGRPHRRRAGARHGGGRARPLRAPRFPRQQRRHRQPRHRWWRKTPTPGGASCRSTSSPCSWPSKYAIPAMIKTAGRGAIVNISSISALRPRGLTAYTASKGAVIALTRAMAVDHAERRHPRQLRRAGPRLHADGLRARHDATKRASSAARPPPLGIEGTGWDIGHAVRFLLSDHARYITGQTLVVDGGVTLHVARPRERKPLTSATKNDGGYADGPRALSRQVRPRARAPGPAQAQHHALPGARAQPQRARARSAGSASSSATRAGSTRACASSPSCRSAGSPARPTSGRTTSRSAATSASAPRTSAP